jgi:hypothetical protein
MTYKTLHGIRKNYDLKYITRQSDKQYSTTIYMTYGQTIIYKTLHDIEINNDLQNTT